MKIKLACPNLPEAFQNLVSMIILDFAVNRSFCYLFLLRTSPISVLDKNRVSKTASGQDFLEPTAKKVMDDAGGPGRGFSTSGMTILSIQNTLEASRLN